jgi:hypothetical protein
VGTNVDAVGQELASSLVTQVMPMQVAGRLLLVWLIARDTGPRHKASTSPPMADQRIASFGIVEKLGGGLSTVFSADRSTSRRSHR